ncbi:DUF1385 domain-containing protein [Clostridium cylindrosporum]|uniref:Metal-dependent enzyme n=1 Tax=Clostridium cylindrosporum DSM 605 TaxID=1121307 RepID=A0A0J8DF51_CLOCY|nr:DUF1385 domain-containing protein [Clostridium cylindrosporum]KMT22803.1 hypothetical protein CLCY_5c00420 [Clostridium cylindrosporum DSM 605]
MAKKTNIGGQAVIEGVMMRGPSTIALAVRKENGEIFVKSDKNVPLSKKNKFCSLPIIRGTLALLESLMLGTKMLSHSADIVEGNEENIDRKKDFKEKLVLVTTLVISFGISLLLFALLPTVVADVAKNVTSNTIIINLFEGLIKVIIFLAYIYFIGKMDDVKRVFMYHGAEHKTIFCYEAEEPLTVENVRKYTTLHPRCGTNFMLTVIIVGILVFSVFGWPDLKVRILLRIIMLPIIAGISYEFIKWQGGSDSRFARILSTPGLYLQKLTTKEPDDSQIEVAIEALKAAGKEGEDDRW